MRVNIFSKIITLKRAIEAIKILEKSEFVVNENIQILKLKAHQELDEESNIVIPDQFMNIQKAAFDICKISERILL